jgi:copper chaperone
MDTVTYIVEGMTCDHCVAAVSREVGAVAGVRDVSVDLPTGRIVVVGDATAEDVSAAVDAAGYALTGVA